MNDATTAQQQLRRRARMMKRINVPMRLVLGLPFETPLSSRLMLLSYTGRKSGRAYRQPVSYVRDGKVLLTPGGGKWKLNLREGEPVKVRLGGRDIEARPEFVRNAEDVERLVRYMMTKNRRLASFIPFVERDRTIDQAKLETALNHSFAIVRWHLAATEQ